MTEDILVIQCALPEIKEMNYYNLRKGREYRVYFLLNVNPGKCDTPVGKIYYNYHWLT